AGARGTRGRSTRARGFPNRSCRSRTTARGRGPARRAAAPRTEAAGPRAEAAPRAKGAPPRAALLAGRTAPASEPASRNQDGVCAGSSANQPSGEDAVRAVAVREGAKTRVLAAERGRKVGSRVVELELRMSRQKSLHDRVGLLRFERADTIYHRAARLDERRRRLEERPLERRHLRDRARFLAPPRVGAAPKHAQARAGRVDQDAREGTPNGRGQTVGADGPRPREAKPFGQIRSERAGAARVALDRHDEAIRRDRLGDLRRFPAGRRAEIERAIARRR